MEYLEQIVGLELILDCSLSAYLYSNFYVSYRFLFYVFQK